MHKEPPLWQRLYQGEVSYETARIIGYDGVAPFDFWDAAKPLAEKHGKGRVESAVFRLTRYDRREASPPRYELTNSARTCCFQLLGPAPEHPEFARYYPDGRPTLKGEEPAQKPKRKRKVR
jgi:hypothetical protein